MISRLLQSATVPFTAVKVLTDAGVIRFYGPATLAAVARTVGAWGTGLAGGVKSASIRYPDRVALVDDLGDETFAALESRGNAVADSLAARGVGEGDAVALMARNHRYFLEVALGTAKLGADVVLLNTAFAAPQLADVLEREGPVAVVYDAEFAGLFAHPDVRRVADSWTAVVAWTDDEESLDPGVLTMERLIADGSDSPRFPPERSSRAIILTSGTTGTPKGAPRGNASASAALALLSKIPLRNGDRTLIAAPLFHTWGWAHLMLGMLLGNAAVLTRRFEPASALRLVSEQRCTAVVVIPVMLQRILQAPKEVLAGADFSGVRVVASSGSVIPGSIVTAWMDAFGDNLYNIYGSTEVAWATIAAPADLRAAPTTAGQVPFGTEVRLFDNEGRPVPQGSTGRIFVGNSMLFEGYTGGGDKERIDGLMSSGDVGRFDEHGRLFVEGRDDDMIVSGGENVFPQEVEEVLAAHPDVVEAAAIGVPDDDFGQRLRGFVVLHEGAVPNEAALLDHVRSQLARYKVPRELVFLPELPRNATGKIVKRTLGEVDL